MTTEREGAIPDSVTYRGVREILRGFAESKWTAMHLEVHGMRITVGKNGRPADQPSPPSPSPRSAPPSTSDPVAPAPPAAPPAPPADTEGLVAVRSPAVGSFWVSPSPGQPPFVAAGQRVGQDEQLAIVEVMKLMNPVLAPEAGEVVRVCAADAELVEYDQVLFLIRPSDG